MFHNLIYNKDPNEGNWMVDPAWNLIIIDNSRAFTTDTDERVHKLTRVDRDLWDQMATLDEPTLQAALGEWLNEKEIRAILQRRGEMRKDIGERSTGVHTPIRILNKRWSGNADKPENRAVAPCVAVYTPMSRATVSTGGS